MNTIENLLINQHSYEENPKSVNYRISSEQLDPDSKENIKKYYDKAIDAISEDITKRKLEHITISVDGKFLDSFYEVAREKVSMARYQYESVTGLKMNSWETNVASIGFVLGGMAGLVLGYGYFSDIAHDVTESISNNSYLLSLFSGPIEAGLSLTATGISGIIGSFSSIVGSAIITYPITLLKNPLAKNFYGYKKISDTIFD